MCKFVLPKKNFILPAVSAEAMALPAVAAFHAAVQQAADETNALLDGSETDIRDHVKKQKVSGGTRSDLGRQCRDTFSSLKKTCRKLKISFWDYLIDRVSCSDQIPPLSQFIEQRFA